ncbi:MAG TPA: hypothetical protein VHX43_11140 [Xanthobacteraceae bacterium]|jgi:hypothetical protein|nr:hypothetical protein [Xanthobacteraceae bacterium]
MSRFQEHRVELPGAIPRRAVFVGIVAAALLGSVGAAYSGPCTDQIAALKQQIKALPAGPKTGPTFSQTLGAQLHHQPTPEDVQHAQKAGRKEAGAALKAAEQADAAGNASACNAALDEAKRLYDIGQ